VCASTGGAGSPVVVLADAMWLVAISQGAGRTYIIKR
jgi:hypothetical protein